MQIKWEILPIDNGRFKTQDAYWNFRAESFTKYERLNSQM